MDFIVVYVTDVDDPSADATEMYVTCMSVDVTEVSLLRMDVTCMDVPCVDAMSRGWNLLVQMLHLDDEYGFDIK